MSYDQSVPAPLARPGTWLNLDERSNVSDRTCNVDGCVDPVNHRRPNKGLCTRHLTRWYRHGDVHRLINMPKPDRCQVAGCEIPPRTKGLCPGHYTRLLRGMLDSPKPLRRQRQPGATYHNVEGYVRIKIPGHRRGNKDGWVLEHIAVMESVLGRALFAGETVHHRNGVRDDNRPENLELWVVSQPPGQSVEDLLSWAMEILERYGHAEAQRTAA